MCLTTNVWTQGGIAITGKVVSLEDGAPIIGASVVVVNTTIGTATDAEGKFSLVFVPSNRRTISVSAVGYKSASKIAGQFDSLELLFSLIPSVIQAQTVVVTANKREQSLEEVPVSMSIIEARAFEQRNTIALDDVLRYVPGVNFQQSQVNIRASSGYSRGVGSRVLLLMDGVPLLSGDTGEITFESIPVFQIDKVEVVKGAGSALYGSGALGGVINVLTKEVDEHTTVWWKLYGGVYSDPAYDQWKWSNNTRWMNGQSIGFSTRSEDAAVAASVQRISDDGYREQDWRRKYSAFLKAQYDLSPYQSITVTSNLFQQYRGDFLWWKDLKNALRPADAQKNITVSSLRFNNAVQYKHFVTNDFYYETKAVHFRGNWYRDSLNNKRMDESISDAVVAELQGNLSIGSNNIFTAGIVGNYERVKANIFGNHYGNGAALYLQNEYMVTKGFSAIAGLRHDFQQVIGLQQYQQTNPKLGVRYTIEEGHTVRLSAGRGFRAPSIGELYTSTKNTGSVAIIIPSINLQPEHSEAYEISSSNNLTENLRLETALFHSDYSDLIEPNVQSDTAVKAVTLNFRNITQARIRGFELSVLTSFLSHSVTVDGHYNYNWAIDTKTGAFLRFRPRHIASINAEWTKKPFEFGADYRFVSRIEAIDDKLVELAPIKNGSQRVANHIVDARCGLNLIEFGIPVRATLNINNLFGYNYNELIGNISPPRHFVLSFEGILQ
ncbi:MAG: TonB-dependent receptor [Bacteroidetes bacterium]|nr:TonB-dependent receptor [Bacteroidota bacterium]